MATGGPTWDHELGPLTHQFWATAENIFNVCQAKGFSNTRAQAFMTAVLNARNASNANTANTKHTTMVTGLASSNWS